eukprot:CAMPEP_0174819286 /NCGR_PEP_ID=MMETSP1107-20130205/2415_1 /TAXON_ID=36770 /ORGANISM="Paraphysomonas vestita, Strain GFlagA" /LENGTH=263 /DNA_ID=CAMNT_0016032481 /DNA_START=1392 /DNA_END=2184 /DNA_ORIENTATION=+
MAVRRIAWGPGDHYLFSAGADGNVYGWSLEHDHRIDVVASSNRSTGIQGLAIDGADTTLVGMNLERIVGRTTIEWGGDGTPGNTPEPNGFIVGTYCALISSQDGTIRFAEWRPQSYDGKSLQSRDDSLSPTISVNIDDRVFITCLIVSLCKKFLYCGMSDGSLRIYEWPIKSYVPSFIEVQAHSASVVDIRESPTGHIIVTVSEDGSIFIHSILKGQLAALSGGDNSMDMYSMASELGGFIYNSDTVQIAKDDMDDQYKKYMI